MRTNSQQKINKKDKKIKNETYTKNDENFVSKLLTHGQSYGNIKEHLADRMGV